MAGAGRRPPCGSHPSARLGRAHTSPPLPAGHTSYWSPDPDDGHQLQPGHTDYGFHGSDDGHQRGDCRSQQPPKRGPAARSARHRRASSTSRLSPGHTGYGSPDSDNGHQLGASRAPPLGHSPAAGFRGSAPDSDGRTRRLRFRPGHTVYGSHDSGDGHQLGASQAPPPPVRGPAAGAQRPTRTGALDAFGSGLATSPEGHPTGTADTSQEPAERRRWGTAGGRHQGLGA